jgi:hypothetical protein
LTLALGVAAFLTYLHLLGRGPFASFEMRHLRAMKNRTTTPDRIEPIGLPEFLALPRRVSVAEYSGLERRAVSMVGQVPAMMRAMDGDFHLELVPEQTATGITAEITPAWRGEAAADPDHGWGYQRLLTVFRPDAGGVRAWEGGPARVRISGWLLYDGASDVALRLLRLPIIPRATDWEIHPVTKIERWDAATADWIEVKR